MIISHPGYQEAIAHELLCYNVNIPGITEACIEEFGVDRLEHYTVYHSGGKNHTRGVTLCLDNMLSSHMLEMDPGL